MNDEQYRQQKTTRNSVGTTHASPIQSHVSPLQNLQRHHRRSIRLCGYDYSQAGAYFITICTHKRACLLGKVVNGQTVANEYGVIVRECWLAIPQHFPGAVLDEFVVMPNHVHGIIVLNKMPPVGARHAVPLPHAVPPQDAVPLTNQFGKPIPGSIPTIVGSFKSAATKRINEHRGTSVASVWQRNYYEHIIRNEDSLNRIRQYIFQNPMRWASDRENPFAVSPESEDVWA